MNLLLNKKTAALIKVQPFKRNFIENFYSTLVHTPAQESTAPKLSVTI